MRVCISGVKETLPGRFSVMFDAFMGHPGSETLIGTMESGPVFPNEDAAYAGGKRALALYDAVGVFPDMTRIF